MGIVNNIIVSPVNLKADVATVLGESNASVGYLCSNQHGKINMWSRMKPVHIVNTDFPDRTKEWWRGTLNDCGIIVLQVSNYSQVKAIVDNSDTLNGWSYRPPSGGSGSPYRMGDFIGYAPNATPPIHDFTVTPEIMEGGTIVGICMMNSAPSSNTSGSLSIGDINCGGKKLSECHMGLVIYDESGNIRGHVVSNGLTAEFNVSGLKNDTQYWAYPFVAHTPMPQGSLDVANNYFTIPYATKQGFRIVDKMTYYGIGIKISGKVTLGISWNLSLTASKQNFTVTSYTIYCRFTDSNWNDVLLKGEYMKTNDTPFEVKQGSVETTRNGVFSSIDTSRSYKLLARVHTNVGVFETEAYVLKENL